MIVYKGQYWLEICNEEYYNPKNLYQEDIDGFWVAYLYSLYHSILFFMLENKYISPLFLFIPFPPSPPTLGRRERRF